MGRARRPVSTFAGLPPELKQALRAGGNSRPPVPDEPSAPKSATKDTSDDDASGSEPDPELYAATQRPTKRRRIDSSTPRPHGPFCTASCSRDPVGLVPFYSSQDQVPQHLAKYWHQRERLFSRYDEGCLLDEEGWYSVTPERVASQIAARCACNVVLDAFCGVGGNAIAFAQTCERVIAIDNSPLRLALARHNAQIYGVADRIEFILGDFLDFARTYPSKHKTLIDVVFLSPPWGGPAYLTSSPSKQQSQDAGGRYFENAKDPHPEYSLATIQPVPGSELFALARSITPHVAFFLPRNTDPQEVASLVANQPKGSNSVEVEEEWMGNKLKALTCYFGGLAAGQEHLFQEQS
ncbi:S-adenosyl-L-methionine-dependent methyltransferase [Auriculariales sp. MPI-PUGE-AT-0066]|nr:S-adenosyl-L-methionine-dependent methyltransferase [Auriculariales sp. MPI-PUGE-AT-0066]